MTVMSAPAAMPASASNPLLQAWETPFAMPPFASIRPEHFRPAFDIVLARHRAAADAIAGDPAAPDFDNTVAALERSWQELSRLSAVFSLLTETVSNDALEALDREISPLLARHYSAIYQHAGLFRRIAALAERGAVLPLDAEQRRVLERYHRAFVRSGAALTPESRERLAAINERLATLGTAFGQNVLADEKAFALVLEEEADLAGLPDFVRAAALADGGERGLVGKHVITLSRSSIEPFLQFSARRDLRERAFRAWTMRGDNGGAHDNKPLIAEMLALRDERARLLGFASQAHYRLDDAMAKTPQAARAMLDRVWPAARDRAERDRTALQELVRQEGGNFALAPWDWRYYAEKLRKARLAVEEAEIKLYLQLDNIIAAAFYVAGRLFGISFEPLRDAPAHHPDVRVWTVTDAAGRHRGVFVGDYFARPSKRSGAWMMSLRRQQKLAEHQPVVVNVMNFSKGQPGAPALLSMDGARTLFHEFGHALHGLLSDVTYPMLAGTSVATDFVEFPSQLYEHWLEQPEVLGRFAVHAETGEPMPPELLQRVARARNFDQGRDTLEYLASAIVDLDLHTAPRDGVDAAAVERTVLDRIGVPDVVTMRHRPPHFQHIFSGEGYAAAYYSYMWSEMLDADGFAAFMQAGDIFDPTTARRLHDYVYAAGNVRDPAEAYRLFRGTLPQADAVLAKRGLAA